MAANKLTFRSYNSRFDRHLGDYASHGRPRLHGNGLQPAHNPKKHSAPAEKAGALLYIKEQLDAID